MRRAQKAIDDYGNEYQTCRNLKGKGIASYKLPERLEVVEELPLVSHGSGMPKIDKKALLADITEKLKREGKISDRGD